MPSASGLAFLVMAVALGGCVLVEEAGCAADCGTGVPASGAPASRPSVAPTPTVPPLSTPSSAPTASTPPATPDSTPSTSTTTAPTPGADEVEVRDVRVEAGPDSAAVSWTVWPSAPKEPIRVASAGDGTALAQCFCPTEPELVDGRYVSVLSTLAGGTQMPFRLQSYVASEGPSGSTRYSPVILHEGTLTTAHAPLAILQVSAVIEGNSIWFNADTTGDGKLFPVFRWSDENGTTRSMSPAGIQVQGHASMGTYSTSFGAGPYTAVMELSNDRGEAVTSPAFTVERR